MTAAHRFNNELRYREGDHPNQTQFTPEYVLEPVRVDLGYQQPRTDLLNVVTETVVNGQRQIVTLPGRRPYQPEKTLLDRFQLHFSIGQPW